MPVVAQKKKKKKGKNYNNGSHNNKIKKIKMRKLNRKKIEKKLKDFFLRTINLKIKILIYNHQRRFRIKKKYLVIIVF